MQEDFQRRLLLAIGLSEAQRDSLRDLRDRLQLELDHLQRQVDDGYVMYVEGRLRYRESLQAYRAARDSVLTEAQLALIDRARRYQRERQLDDGRDDEQPRLVEALEMSSDQQRRWLVLLERLRSELATLREDSRTPTQLDYRRLREEYGFAFEAILTAEQRLELERYKLERARRLRELEEVELGVLDGFDSEEPDSLVDASLDR